MEVPSWSVGRGRGWKVGTSDQPVGEDFEGDYQRHAETCDLAWSSGSRQLVAEAPAPQEGQREGHCREDPCGEGARRSLCVALFSKLAKK